MNLSKIFKIFGVSSIIGIFGSIMCFFIIIAGVVNFFGHNEPEVETNYEVATTVRNNYAYSMPYRRVLNKYLKSNGYVSLERLVFYLQRTNNVLDVSLLNDKKWQEAYLANLNSEKKQMIPVGQICKTINENNSLPRLTITSNDKYDVIDLCSGTNLDENYKILPYVFPLKSSFTVTSFPNEQRNVMGKTDVHNGWDLAVPIGTDFYSICSGTISNITNAQPNDLKYSISHNTVGNFVKVKCDNGLTAIYYHIKYKSTPLGLKVGSKVNGGDLLGKTSTTGHSDGPHLHVGLVDVNKNILDSMEYTDMNK